MSVGIPSSCVCDSCSRDSQDLRSEFCATEELRHRLELDLSGGIEASYRAMNGWILAKVRMRFFSLVLLFALCQIVGAMCTVPDLSLADDAAQLAEAMNHMACPMDGTIMCPPSLTASPERQVKNSMVVVGDPVLSLARGPALPKSVSLEMIWSWSSAYSSVPISISSSSVLRI